MADFDKAIGITLGHEGVFSDDPLDPGKATKYGISQKAYPNEYIEGLTIDRAKFLYKRDYWDKIKGDDIIDQKVAELLFDSSVNVGIKQAVLLAQRVANVEDDGIIGKNTIAALNALNAPDFMNAFAVRKIAYYVDIVKRKPSQKIYLLGWIDRTLKSVL